MGANQLTTQLPQDEKVKVAYALNLCAVSISQIIDSKDIVVLKQERESILGNLNLQNFVKHPALLAVLKQILDTITYLEIQAGDLGFIEKEYQQKLKNAIWSAIPSPGALFAGGGPATMAIAIVAQIGTGYMNYRRNKSQYGLDKQRSEWELKRHELEQLHGLRAQLFETAWALSADYNFDDKFRLTQKQLSRYSAALLEENPLKRFERLDVMSDKFDAFPPFWYHKANAAMEVFRSKQYGAFASGYKDEALKAYNEFHKRHFEFLREDVIAASCCIEHISLLAPSDALTAELLRQAIRFAGENYDVLQQSVFVNLQLKNFGEIVAPLREMIVNDYNVGLNGILLSRIYLAKSNRIEYEKLCAIAGVVNVVPWSDDADNADIAEKRLVKTREAEVNEAYRTMVKRISRRVKLEQSPKVAGSIYLEFGKVLTSLLKYADGGNGLAEASKNVESKLKQAAADTNDATLSDFSSAALQLLDQLMIAGFRMQIVEDAPSIIDDMRKLAKQ